MKKADITKTMQSSKAELEKKIQEIRQQIRVYDVSAGRNQPKNTRSKWALRKQLAQLLTIEKQKTLEKASI